MECKHKFHLVGFQDMGVLIGEAMETVKVATFVCEDCGMVREKHCYKEQLKAPEEPKKEETPAEEPTSEPESEEPTIEPTSEPEEPAVEEPTMEQPIEA